MHLAKPYYSIGTMAGGSVCEFFFFGGILNREAQRLHRSIESGNHVREFIRHKDSKRSAVGWFRYVRSFAKQNAPVR